MEWHEVIEETTGLTAKVWARKGQPYADLQWMARMAIVDGALKLEAKFGEQALGVTTTRTFSGQKSWLPQ